MTDDLHETMASALRAAAFRLYEVRKRCSCFGKMEGRCPRCAETHAAEEKASAALDALEARKAQEAEPCEADFRCGPHVKCRIHAPPPSAESKSVEDRCWAASMTLLNGIAAGGKYPPWVKTALQQLRPGAESTPSADEIRRHDEYVGRLLAGSTRAESKACGCGTEHRDIHPEDQ